MRVALVQCPVWGTREPPLALVQLSACLKAQGHEARSFDLNNHLYRHRRPEHAALWAWEQSQFWYSPEQVGHLFADIAGDLDAFIDQVLRFEPRMVGFSVSASTFAATAAVSALLKRRDPGLVIAYGGQAFFDRSFVERTFAATVVDHVLVDAADRSIAELAWLLEEERDWRSCRGVYGRHNGAVIFSGDRQPLRTLDDLPYLDFTDLSIHDYDDDRHISLMASRGCVWRCAFCSSRSFWPGYQFMSGERIHQEILYHRTLLPPDMAHIDFADLCFNGNMQRVEEFCDLMVRYPPAPLSHPVGWNANMIVHPGLTRALLETMRAAGCRRVTFGIESGSPAVLQRMRKNYDPAVAVRVVRDAAAVGIRVTCNFMFGFPGETEEDFAATLDFVRRAGTAIDRAYPSRTYCAIEQWSDLHDHPEAYGVRTPFNHHLYWESLDGSNTYPVRLKRCQRFEALCRDLGVTIDCGVQTAVDLDEWFNLGYYYEHRGDRQRALDFFSRYHAADPRNEVVAGKVRDLSSALKGGA